ncbi:hypothetical protein V3G39_06690 [Dermatophilaceae bacterium Sec6.4]
MPAPRFSALRLPTLERTTSLYQWAPALVALLTTIVIVLPHGINLGVILIYALATIWGVLIPGTILTRLCRGQARSILEEISVGFVVGMMTQLIAWGAFVALGIGAFLVVYPLPLIAVAVAVPRWRAQLRSTVYEERQPWWASWSVAAAYVVAIWLLASRMFASYPLPPATARWYPDLYWHVAVAASARTSVPPLVPQVSGQELKYHWFSNAHMAADSLISGVDILHVASRLWYLPVYAAIIALTYLLATRLAGSPKAGLTALVLLLTNAAINPVRWIAPLGTDPIVPLSPSEVMGVPVLIVATWWVIDIVRGRRLGRAGWVLLGLIMLTCAGSKSSNLPVLLCGLLLVGVLQLVIRARLRQTWISTGLCLAAIAVTAPFLLGGGNVSKLAAFAAPGGRLNSWVPAAAIPNDVWKYTFLVVLSMLVLLQLASLLLAVPLLKDPAVVLLFGMILAGFSATLIVLHPSGSELYFLRGVMPLSDILIAWGVVYAMRCHDARWWRAGVAAVVGGGIGYAAASFTRKTHPSANAAFVVTCTATGVLLALLAVGIVLWRRSRATPRAGSVRAVLAGLLVGAAVIPSGITIARSGPSHAYIASPANQLSPGAVPATTWLRTHTPEQALLATNVHCRKARTTRICDSRALWVTALSERRAYVSSWGYTDQAYATANHPRPGEKGVFYWSASFYDQPRLRLNDSAFNAPTPKILATLYNRGVRYLIGDTSASPVSPLLATMAQQTFHSGNVTVYRLRKP